MIKKNDQVLVIKGKDRGKKGKVLRVLPKHSKVLVEGVNIKKKHRRPRKQGEKGQVIETIAPLSVSNLKLICSKCGKPVRTGCKVMAEKKKIRICKKCGEEV
ncbi:50S ribosomal protein L24 [Patescibacteria group bacterium]|nr:50S ribosomal protein L24 [Patescibacteria group bacterium]